MVDERPLPKRRPRAAYVVRQATLHDVAAIVALNELVYPTPEDAVQVWTREHIESQLRVFGEGQMVVEHKGQVVASASALIVSFGRDPYRDHTWSGITDNGRFFNHDPWGDTLYGADVNVHPRHRRRGLGRMLYEARRELCRRKNLRRIVVGGRLHDYCEHASEMTAEEWARRVEAGDAVDAVLTFHLGQGMSLKRVMPSYIKDARSGDYATFLEWLNPGYAHRYRKARAIRLSCVQFGMREVESFDEFGQQVRYFTDVAAGYGSDVVVFPELVTAPLMRLVEVKTAREAIRRLTDYGHRVDSMFHELAARFQLAILGGSHPRKVGDHIENVASLYLPDGTVARQSKLHITPSERRYWGIEGGTTLAVFDTPKARVGVLVCYDIQFPEAARFLADQGAEVILVPFCTDDRQAYLRVRYCAQARAVENQVYVAMAGTVGNLPNVENMDIQYAQSAVLSPSDFPFARDGILVEASVNTETVITTDLDFESLEEAINEGTVRQRNDRRPDLFRFEAVGLGHEKR